MKIKRAIFAAVSGGKIIPGEAQSEGAAHRAAAHMQDENDSSYRDNAVDRFHQRLIVRAATIDELLSDDFEPLDGDTDIADRRLSAWRRASTAGDQALFERRLARDGRSTAEVLARFGAVRHKGPAPAWLADAQWIEAVLQSRTDSPRLWATDSVAPCIEPCAFEQLFLPVLEAAEVLLRADIDARVFDHFSDAALADLRRMLLSDLSGLCAAALYERFRKARQEAGAAVEARPGATSFYDRFIADMRAGGFRRLFEDKPVLLRLLATMTRQWIDTSREFVLRLDADLPIICRDLLKTAAASQVAKIEGELSDPHNFGHSVQIVTFEDSARVVYKPKDLRLDIVWHGLIGRLNRADPPVALKAVRAIARDGYGWTEFVTHAGCDDEDGVVRFFRRAGAWLALFHVFAATDMHQENMIAHGDHPVPIDLETILQPSAEEHKVQEPEGEAFDAAMEIVGNSVMTVGLLPAYGRSVDNNVFAMGGMTADWGARTVITWNDINSDAMRPAKQKEAGTTNTNLPHVAGDYAKFGDHIGDFVAGFADYAQFLRRVLTANRVALFDGFARLPVRKVVRPTRF
jgi:type 2 lantibiotic biosynthesis protein LanM